MWVHSYHIWVIHCDLWPIHNKRSMWMSQQIEEYQNR